MVSIAALSEDFSSGQHGDSVGAAYGQVDAASGTGTSVIEATAAYDGYRACRFTNTASSRILRFDFTDGALDTAGWIRFDFEVVTPFNVAVALAYLYAANNVTVVGSLRLETSGAIALRDSANVQRDVSSALAPGIYSISWRPTPSAHLVKIYNSAGDLVDTLGPVATGMAVLNADTLRLGPQVNSTGSMRMWRLRADDAVEPAGVTPPPVGDASLAGVETRVRILDYTGAGNQGVVDVTQTAGPAAVSIVESPTGLFTITLPTPFDTAMVFNVTADDAGDIATEVVTFTPDAGQPKFVFRPNAALSAWI